MICQQPDFSQLDFQRMLEIERLSFPEPWTAEEFAAHFANFSCGTLTCIADELLVGFALFSFVPQALWLDNLAIHPDYRRRGCGQQLVQILQHKLDSQRDRLCLHVRETNLAAQLFFKACGFQATATVRELYQNTEDDAYRMVYRPSPP